MSTGHSVTAWIAALKGGDEAAIEALVQRYFEKLVRVGRNVYHRRFGDLPRPTEDEEDAALSALRSFWARATDQGFPELVNRSDLWRLLVKITIRKVYRQRRRAMSSKRGGEHAAQALPPEGLDKIVDDISAPEAAVEFEDTCQAAIAVLDDPNLRRVAEMRLEGRTPAEIAEELGVTERTVYRRLEAIRDTWDRHFAEGD